MILPDFDLSKCVVFDVEVYSGRWCVGFSWSGTTIVVDGDRDVLAEYLRCFADQSMILVGYNSERFDIPVIQGILAGIDPYQTAQSIINAGRTPAFFQEREIQAPTTADGSNSDVPAAATISRDPRT